MNLATILEHKYPGIRFNVDVRLRDDGDGPFIEHWSLPVPQPSVQELFAEAPKYDAAVREAEVRKSRALAYPAVGDQLDMLYKAMQSGEIPTAREFVDAISAVKAAFPKPARS